MRRCRSSLLSCCVVSLAVGTLPAMLAAQTVRGTVTDRAGGALGAGAVVILEDAADSTVAARSVLADASGRFSVLAFAPGTYRLSVRRIGRVPFLSEELTLAAGEVRVLDVQMEPIPVRGLGVAVLSTVRVRRATPCDAATDEGARIATLWDDARTALMATEISTRDRLVTRKLVRFVRDIDVPSMNVISERLKAFDAKDVPNQPHFRSLSGDSLSLMGYWRVKKGTQMEFHGVDANALLSEAFVRDHCFTLVEDSDDRRGWVGLDFEPIEVRTRRHYPPEVRGTIWLDAETSALQVVEFVWTKLQGDLRNVGGEVHFARVESGPWFVSSWRLRMPREVVMRGAYGITRHQGIVEEGGLVMEDTLDGNWIPATLDGEVRDRNSRPMAGATVRVLGTELSAVTGPDGRYTLPGVPPGLQFVVADHPSFHALGLRVGQKSLLLDEGSRRSVRFSSMSTSELGGALCADGWNRSRAILRVVLVDSTTAKPLGGVRIRLALKDEARRPAFVVNDETDAGGASVFCGVPAGQVLVVTRGGVPLFELTMGRGQVIGHIVRSARQ